MALWGAEGKNYGFPLKKRERNVEGRDEPVNKELLLLSNKFVPT